MYKRISVQDAKTLLDQGSAQFVDIRDETSFIQGHIPGSQPLSQSNLQSWMASADLDKPLLVCCYHGNSSQPAAQFLFEKGFEDVYSIDGGFEAWQQLFDVETGPVTPL